MESTDYTTDYSRSDQSWVIRRSTGGTTGWVIGHRDKFHALVEVDGQRLTIWTGNGLRTAIEQVIWYDRAMNQEAE